MPDFQASQSLADFLMIQTWLYLMDFGEALHCVNGDFPIPHGHFGGHTG
jgi:hypothetical protein